MYTSDEDQLTDLKQFIGSLFAQQNAQIDQRFTQIDQRFLSLEKQFSELSDFVREAIDTSNDASGQQLADHEQRISKLEQAAA